MGEGHSLVKAVLKLAGEAEEDFGGNTNTVLMALLECAACYALQTKRESAGVSAVGDSCADYVFNAVKRQAGVARRIEFVTKGKAYGIADKS